MNKDIRNHWNNVYSKCELTELGWYEELRRPSIDLIIECKLSSTDVILDVGSGTTNLLSYLINSGFKNITALDISD